MCGIVGYSGQSKQVLSTLIRGLERLEYRGYDSAGLAILSTSRPYVKKAVGKVAELAATVRRSQPRHIGQVGIAHTRWATHGEPSLNNAHPHASEDGKIWVVHNGIIENHQELKARLMRRGISFDSETDTEVIAKLIGSNYRGDLKQAVLAALSQLKGAYALCIVSQDEPHRLIGVKMASPLVVGVAKAEIIISSDVAALIDKTKQVIYLEDGELVDVNGNNYQVSNFDNQPKGKVISHIDWDFEAASKAGHEHYLLKEIMEQPQVIKDSIRGRLDHTVATTKFGGLIDVEPRLKQVQRILLVGVGTAFYAAKLGELYLNQLANIPAQAVMSPEFRYTHQVIDEHTWVIAISQSGETADTIAAIEAAKRAGALVTGIVNAVGSTIARLTDAGVYNHIGPEISVASTKAFTSQSLLLLMHAVLVGRQRKLNRQAAVRLLNAIARLPEDIDATLVIEKKIEQLATQFEMATNLLYIGRQYNYPIALEGALKIKEIAYVHAEGLSGGELKHGFLALVDKNLTTIAIATDDQVFEKIVANIAEVKARRGPVIAIANRKINEADYTLVVPKSSSALLQPLVNNVALQLLAYYVANKRQLDIDQPRNLAKSVTVE